MIGKAEYDERWCLNEIQKSNIILEKDDDVAIFKDYVNTYTKSEIEEGGDTKYDTGCCRVPKGARRVKRSENCIYTPNYKEPTIKERVGYFLKRFK